MDYDTNNIFAKILRGEIPCSEIYKDNFALAFSDINPRAKIHALVIPTGPYVSSEDFHERANDSEIIGYYRALDKVLEKLKLKDKTGYRLLSNSGIDAGQEVPHFHTHIFAGENLGPMLAI